MLTLRPNPALIPSTILSRIVACAPFADPISTGTMGGVRVATQNGNIVVAATDGVVLIEETFRACDHNFAMPENGEFILSRDSIHKLKKFLAAIGKNRVPVDLEFLPDMPGIILAHKSESVTLTCVKGTFPNYSIALYRPAEKTQPGTFAINMRLASLFDKAWCLKEKGSAPVMFEWNGFGFRVRPVGPDAILRVGFIMPITLPT